MFRRENKTDSDSQSLFKRVMNRSVNVENQDPPEEGLEEENEIATTLLIHKEWLENAFDQAGCEFQDSPERYKEQEKREKINQK